MRLLRKKIKGWSKNIEAELKRKKKDTIKKLDSLDQTSEYQQLSPRERQDRKELKETLEKIWVMEEIKARQRVREK
jgi:hypothetical protein